MQPHLLEDPSTEPSCHAPDTLWPLEYLHGDDTIVKAGADVDKGMGIMVLKVTKASLLLGKLLDKVFHQNEGVHQEREIHRERGGGHSATGKGAEYPQGDGQGSLWGGCVQGQQRAGQQMLGLFPEDSGWAWGGLSCSVRWE